MGNAKAAEDGDGEILAEMSRLREETAALRREVARLADEVETLKARDGTGADEKAGAAGTQREEAVGALPAECPACGSRLRRHAAEAGAMQVCPAFRNLPAVSRAAAVSIG